MMTPDAEAHVKENYPSLADFLETVMWPDVDSDNLFEMLHRVMKHWHPDFVRQLVIDVKQISEDTLLADDQIVELFARDIPERYRVVVAQNCRALLWSVGEYLQYLYDEEMLHGMADPDPAAAE